MSRKHTPEFFSRRIDLDGASISVMYKAAHAHSAVTELTLLASTTNTDFVLRLPIADAEALASQIRASLEEIRIHNFLKTAAVREGIERAQAAKDRKASK